MAVAQCRGARPACPGGACRPRAQVFAPHTQPPGPRSGARRCSPLLTRGSRMRCAAEPRALGNFQRKQVLKDMSLSTGDPLFARPMRLAGSAASSEPSLARTRLAGQRRAVPSAHSLAALTREPHSTAPRPRAPRPRLAARPSPGRDRFFDLALVHEPPPPRSSRRPRLRLAFARATSASHRRCLRTSRSRATTSARIARGVPRPSAVLPRRAIGVHRRDVRMSVATSPRTSREAATMGASRPGGRARSPESGPSDVRWLIFDSENHIHY